MAEWKKVLVSGSNIEVNQITGSGDADIQGTLSIEGIADVSASIAAAQSRTTADVTANIAAGAIDIGDTVTTGTTLQDLVEQLLVTTYNPTFSNPTFSLSDNVSNFQIVGDTINTTLTFNFNRGSIVGDRVSGVNGTWDATAIQDNRAGAATNYTINSTNNGTSNSLTVTGHTVTLGTNSFSGQVTFANGPQPLDSNGDNYDSPYTGATTTRSVSFEGVYPIILGTSGGGETNRSLVSHGANNIECEQNYSETASLRHRILIPDAMIASQTVTMQQFNTSNNTWGNLASSEFTVTSVTRTIEGSLVNYKLYTKASPPGGVADYRIVFS